MIDLKKELQQGNIKKREGASSGAWLEEALDAAFDNDEGKQKDLVKAAEHGIKRNWKWFALEVGVVLLVVLLIFNVIIGVFRISGDSMKPNFCDGDRIVAFRLNKNVKKGDIIVFKTENGEKLIKRVIATEGDTVDISRQGGLYINGNLAQEDYIYASTGITDETVQYPITVREDCYFVLGDNRTNSKDSRTKEIGLVSKKAVVGRVVLDIKGI